eukprot:CFRG3609T1
MSHTTTKPPPRRPTTEAPEKTTLNGGAPQGFFAKMRSATKQMIQTKLFHVEQTPDPEIENSIANFESNKKRYTDMMEAAKALHKDMLSATNHRQDLAQIMQELGTSVPSTKLGSLYEKNTLALGTVSLESQLLLDQVANFIATMDTTITKIMEDTVVSIRMWEQARLNFDALREELESPSIQVDSIRQQDLIDRKAKLDNARLVVRVKLELLEKNLLVTMEHQLHDFYSAFGHYFVNCARQYQSDPGIGVLERTSTPHSTIIENHTENRGDVVDKMTGVQALHTAAVSAPPIASAHHHRVSFSSMPDDVIVPHQTNPSESID